jgi:hypothetical protein
MSSKTFLINWTGPFKSIYQMGETGYENGIYLLTGRRPYQRKDELQYIGIAPEQTFVMRLSRHHRLWKISKNLEIWLGIIHYPIQTSWPDIELVESALIYVSDPPLNEKKRKTPPSKPLTVVSRWFKPDGQPRKNKRRMFQSFYNVISTDEGTLKEGIWYYGKETNFPEAIWEIEDFFTKDGQDNTE